MCECHHPERRIQRRTFLAASAAALVAGCASAPSGRASSLPAIAPHGPASRYTPQLKAAFVRRKGAYGLRWPGEVYDGEAARVQYAQSIRDTASALGAAVEIREAPLYSLEEGQQWIAQAQAARADGLILVLLDRQEHAWPTATCAVDSPVPAVIFSPLGTAFTINTAPLADKPGAFISSATDFNQAAYGIKMLVAGARLRETRFIVIAGDERKDETMPEFGTKLRYIPAGTFLDRYNATPDSDEIDAIAHEYLTRARSIHGATPADVRNGVKSFVVARTLLEQEGGDAITMDCLGALHASPVSLPCIAWSRMLDHGIPAACEADRGACIAHALVQYLFDRPGFEQDPVADTENDCLIGAHCTCPTRLRGYDAPPEPFRLQHHHGNRDAVPVPRWNPGERITVLDVLLSEKPDEVSTLLVSAGEVVDNLSVPPAGGCVVSVRVRIDGAANMLAFPGFHQLFFYGDFKKELVAYAQLFRLNAQIA